MVINLIDPESTEKRFPNEHEVAKTSSIQERL